MTSVVSIAIYCVALLCGGKISIEDIVHCILQSTHSQLHMGLTSVLERD